MYKNVRLKSTKGIVPFLRGWLKSNRAQEEWTTGTQIGNQGVCSLHVYLACTLSFSHTHDRLGRLLKGMGTRGARLPPLPSLPFDKRAWIFDLPAKEETVLSSLCLKAGIFINILIFFLAASIGLPGCVEKFDKLAEELVKAAKNDPSKIDEVIEKAQKELGTTTDERQKKSGDLYVKIMKKIKEKGLDFIETEIKRVEKLQKEKITSAKKELFKTRLDILTSFQYSNKGKDEL